MALVIFTPASSVFGVAAINANQAWIVGLLSIAPLFICEAVKFVKRLIGKVKA